MEQEEIRNTENETEKAVSPSVGMDKQKEKRKRNIPAVLVGLLTAGLAVFGVYTLVTMGIDAYQAARAERERARYAEYYSYLIPAAAIDIAPFEDVTAANMTELVEMSVWSILNSGLDPTVYEYDGDELVIPASQVTETFIGYFGSERKIEHSTVQGYGYEFIYDAAANSYKIPLSTITPIYTPVITEVQTVGNSVVLTVGLRNASLYTQDNITGQLTAPEPDKYLRVTLRNTTGGMYMSSVRTSGLPETA